MKPLGTAPLHTASPRQRRLLLFPPLAPDSIFNRSHTIASVDGGAPKLKVRHTQLQSIRAPGLAAPLIVGAEACCPASLSPGVPPTGDSEDELALAQRLRYSASGAILTITYYVRVCTPQIVGEHPLCARCRAEAGDAERACPWTVEPRGEKQYSVAAHVNTEQEMR